MAVLGLNVQAEKRKQVSLEWTETSWGFWQCGMTQEFLSHFLWRTPPLEMRRMPGILSDQAVKGSLLSS